MFKNSSWSPVVPCLAGLLTCGMLWMGAGYGGDVVFPPAGTAEADPLYREMGASADEVSAREINTFHLALLGRAILALPSDLGVTVQYAGIIQDEGNKRIAGDDQLSLRVRIKGRVHGGIGEPLTWHVFGRDRVSITSVWVSVRKTKETVAECPLGKRPLFVNVEGAAGDRESLERKRDELGGRSVLDVLKQLEHGPSNLEVP